MGGGLWGAKWLRSLCGRTMGRKVTKVPGWGGLWGAKWLRSLGEEDYGAPSD